MSGTLKHPAKIGGELRSLAACASFSAEITPEEAAALLERNTANRPLKGNHIKDMARDIRAGQWKFNGDTIRFAVNGELIDGQHRLKACVAADRPIRTMVVTGINDDARETIDRGVRRTIGDQLSLNQTPNAKRVASTLRELVGFAEGSLTGARITASEAEIILKTHPGILAVCSDGRTTIAPQGVILAIAYSGISDGYTAEAHAWRDVWATGVPFYTGDPAQLVRERLIKERNGKYKTTAQSMRRLVLNAWINFRKRRPLTQAKEAANTSIPGWSRRRLGLVEDL